MTKKHAETVGNSFNATNESNSHPGQPVTENLNSLSSYPIMEANNYNSYNSNPNVSASYLPGMPLLANQSVPLSMGHANLVQRNYSGGGSFMSSPYEFENPNKKPNLDEKVSGSSTSGFGSRSTTPMASSNSPMPHQSSSNQSSVVSSGSVSNTVQGPQTSQSQQQSINGNPAGMASYPMSMYPGNAAAYHMHPGMMQHRFPPNCMPTFPPGQTPQTPGNNPSVMRFLTPMQNNGGKNSPQLNTSTPNTESSVSSASNLPAVSTAAMVSSGGMAPNYMLQNPALRGPSGGLPPGAPSPGGLNRPGYPPQYYMSPAMQQVAYMQQQPTVHYMGGVAPPTMHGGPMGGSNVFDPSAAHHNTHMRPGVPPMVPTSGNVPPTGYTTNGPPQGFLSPPHFIPHSSGMAMLPPVAPVNGGGPPQISGFPLPANYNTAGQMTPQVQQSPQTQTSSKVSKSKDNDDGRSSPSRRSQKSMGSLKKAKNRKSEIPIPPSPQSTSSHQDCGESHSFISSPSLSVSQPSLSTGGEKTTPAGSGSNQMVMGHLYPNQQLNGAPSNHLQNVLSMATGGPSSAPSINIPAHINGSVRKLFTLGTEPERVSWLEGYLKFMTEIGKPLTTMPHVAKNHLDLFKLYRVVQEHGGVMEVVRRRLWKEIAQAVNVNDSASAAFTLRRNYVRFLIDYECRFALGGIDPDPLVEQIEVISSKKKRKAAAKAAAAAAAAQAGGPSMEKQLSNGSIDADVNDMASPNTSFSSLNNGNFPEPNDEPQKLPCNSLHRGSTGALSESSIAPPDEDTHKTARSSGSNKNHFLEDVINAVSSETFCLPKKLSSTTNEPTGVYDFVSESSTPTPHQNSSVASAEVNMSVSITNCKAASSKSSTTSSSSHQGNADTTSVTTAATPNRPNNKSWYPPQGPQVNGNSVKSVGHLAFQQSVGATAPSQLPHTGLTPVQQQQQQPPQQPQQILELPQGASKPNAVAYVSSEELASVSPAQRMAPPMPPPMTKTPSNALANQPTPPQQFLSYPQLQHFPPHMQQQQPHRGQNSPFPTHSRSLDNSPVRTLVYGTPLTAHSTSNLTSTMTAMPAHISTQSSLALMSSAGPSRGSMLTHKSHISSLQIQKQNVHITPPPERHVFPVGSVERLHPLASVSRKRKRITSQEFGPVDMWRVMMALKCGLLAEISWALDCLCILTRDSHSSQYFTLASLPNLLDQLVELWVHALNIAKKPADQENEGVPVTITVDNKGDMSTSASRNGLYQHPKRSKLSVLRTHSKTSQQPSYVRVEARNEKDPLSNARWRELMLLCEDEKCAESSKLVSTPCKLGSDNNQDYIMEPTFFCTKNPAAMNTSHSSENFSSSAVLQKEGAISRCVVLSTIFRNLSNLPQNETVMASHRRLLSVLASLLLLDHDHLLRDTRDFAALDSEEQSESHIPWLRPWVALLRENSLVTLTHLSGYIHIRDLPEMVAHPLLQGITHWISCSSVEARDCLRGSRGRPLRSSHLHLTPHRLSLEVLTRLCVLEGNVDYILGAPSADEVQYLFNALGHNITPLMEDPVVREMSLVCLTYLARGWDLLGSHLICNAKPSIISSILTFLEVTEMRVQDIIAKSGFQTLMRNPEAIGTSLDLLRRVGVLMECLGQVSANHTSFTEDHVLRLLELCTSRVLDHQVVRCLINLIHRLHHKTVVPIHLGRRTSVVVENGRRSSVSDVTLVPSKEAVPQPASNKSTQSIFVEHPPTLPTTSAPSPPQTTSPGGSYLPEDPSPPPPALSPHEVVPACAAEAC